MYKPMNVNLSIKTQYIYDKIFIFLLFKNDEQTNTSNFFLNKLSYAYAIRLILDG